MFDLRSLKKTLALVGALALALILAAGTNADAGDNKKKKKKPKSSDAAATTETTSEVAASAVPKPPAEILAAHKHLLAYDTEAARQALSAAPEGAWVATTRGWILEQENKYDEAAAELRRAADSDVKNPAPVLFLGDTLAYADRQGQASDAYAQAEARASALLAASADDHDALYYLGVAQQRQKRFDQAAATLEKARKLRPDEPLTLFQLGATSFYQQKWQQAFDTLSAALEKNSGLALAYYYRGLAASKLDRKDILFNDLDRFVKMAPNSPEAANAKQILSAFK